MNHSVRTGLISAGAAILAAVVFVESQPLLTYLGAGNLPAPVAIARPFLVPLVAYLSGWAAHYLLTRDPEPPIPAGLSAISNQPEARKTGDGPKGGA